MAQPSSEHQLEAYASLTSAAAGEVVQLHVNTTIQTHVRWELFRLGYYQGFGARRIAGGADIPVVPQADCSISADTGLVECAWDAAFEVTIDPTWVSGYYLFKITREDGFETTAPLVVRETKPTTAVVMQASVNTWQAYNYWGGTSLYHNFLSSDAAFQDKQGHQVSFDRPYFEANGAGKLFVQEYWMVRWLEQRGIDVGYVTNIDVDRSAQEQLQGRRLILIVGHDEYWSLAERDALEQARDAGVSLAILSANTGYWRVRFDPSSSGRERRVITCFKSASRDPHSDAPDTTARFRDSPHARPENALTGVMYSVSNGPLGDLPLIVSDPSHWIFAGTHVRQGDQVAVALGGEWDSAIMDDNTPPNLAVVLSSMAIEARGGSALAQAAIYEPTPKSFVFGAGTEDFSLGLGQPQAADARLQRIMENLLLHAGVDVEPTPVPEPTKDLTLRARVSVLAGDGTDGDRDGDASTAEFNAPSGVAVGFDGALYVTEMRNHRVRKIATDGSVSTLAGCGPSGGRDGSFKEGSGTAACFDKPNGVAVGPDGAIYVADTGNHRIRRVTPEGKVRTWLGRQEGYVNGARKDARLAYPTALAFGPDGSLYVVESIPGRLRQVDPEGQVTTLAAELDAPAAVATAPDGRVFVSCAHNGQIIEISGTDQRVIANQAGLLGDRIGPALDAWLRPEAGLVFAGDRLVFSDMANEKIRELVFGTDGASDRIATLVGDDATFADGQRSGLALPRGLCAYRSGYAVADTRHARIVYVEPFENEQEPVR